MARGVHIDHTHTVVHYTIRYSCEKDHVNIVEGAREPAWIHMHLLEVNFSFKLPEENVPE